MRGELGSEPPSAEEVACEWTLAGIVEGLLQRLSLSTPVGSKTSAWRCGEPEQTACSVFLETYNLTFSKHFSCLSPDKLDVVIPIQNTLEKWQLPF